VRYKDQHSSSVDILLCTESDIKPNPLDYSLSANVVKFFLCFSLLPLVGTQTFLNRDWNEAINHESSILSFTNLGDLRHFAVDALIEPSQHDTCIPHFSERITCERILAPLCTMRCRHEHDTERRRV